MIRSKVTLKDRFTVTPATGTVLRALSMAKDRRTLKLTQVLVKVDTRKQFKGPPPSRLIPVVVLVVEVVHLLPHTGLLSP